MYCYLLYWNCVALYWYCIVYFILIIVSSSTNWWIGGEKISGVWYWRGIYTHRIPSLSSSDHDWHKNHRSSYESTCLHYQISGVHGWQSHNHNGSCREEMKFVCEKAIWIINLYKAVDTIIFYKHWHVLIQSIDELLEVHIWSIFETI